MPTNRTIAITEETKEKLIVMKIYPRETFDDIVNRLIDEYKKHQKKPQKKFNNY